ncbi:VWA domain-containing protein [Xanthobacter sp. VNH20]|uniref:VWA domain-containing protein n=1 Tax=Xanthobacter sp. VNH20 TaxID=3156616 RepID=UPI0032B4D5EC
MNLSSLPLPHLFTGLLPAAFHFLRPGWLWAIVPALLLAALAFRRIGAGGSQWRTLVDAHLLRHLSVQETARARRWPVLALLLGWVLAALAMAGPTWQKLPTPALDRRDPTVIVLSLGQSMNATDQSPSRLGAARHKVDDILARMRGGQVGLVIYADAPFVASPLTEDARIIAQMLPELSTELMPVLTDRADLALARATALLRDAGAPAGRIVLISDGAGDDPAATIAAARAAAQAGYRVNVIGVGTLAGSPLLSFDGGVLRGRDGTVLTTRMDEARLREVAAAGRGSFSAMTIDEGDLDTVLAKGASSAVPLDTVLQDSGLSADQWLDMGPWLLLGVLALAPLAFRRGWIAVLLVVALAGALAPRDALAQGANPQDTISQAAPAQGSATGGADAQGSRTWNGLWRTPDQQGADAFARSDYGAAARSFENPQWQASALYKAGAFAEAAAAYARVPDGDYNRGNALARAGKLEDAIKAYDAAIAAHPGQDDPVRADAVFNRELVQKLLDQQKKDQQKKDQDKKDQDKKDQKSDDQKPKDEPGKDGKPKDDKKDQPQKPGDDKKPDQPPPAPDPKAPPQKPEPPKAPPKPEPQKPDPQKPDPQKPPEQKPPEQKPPEQKPPEPPPAPPKPPEPPPPQPPQQPGTPKPLTEEDQNREQTLRLVPDDPTGLLRARIRSHYGGAGVVDPPQN